MLLDKQDIQFIQKHLFTANTNQLTDTQLEWIYEKKFFNIWVPNVYGGLELPLVDGLKLLNKIAYYDGSLAWTITLCSGANMFAGYINPETATSIFKERNVCWGGSGKASGKAIWNGTDYEIEGKWSYATGAPHLTHFTLNAEIYDGEMQRKDANGNPVICSFFINKDDVRIIYDWQTFGLTSTASHSFSVEKINVSSDHLFQLTKCNAKIDTPLFRLSFQTFAEFTLLVNYMGMYKRFLDLLISDFKVKLHDNVNKDYIEEKIKLLLCKEEIYIKMEQTCMDYADNIWQEASKNSNLNTNNLEYKVSNFAKESVRNMRNEMSNLFPLSGIKGAQSNEEINLVFRNFFTATQHRLLQ